MGNLNAVRNELRRRRQAIAGMLRQQKSAAAAQYAQQFLAQLPQAQHIGVFLSLPEEIDTSVLVDNLWRQKKSLYLPVVKEKQAALAWREYRRDTALIKDIFGIATPSDASAEWQGDFDIVLVPLVGVDVKGNRLGMGGGFYDRTFADKIRGHRPWLIGFAYECQLIDHIQRRDWDVPLDALATDAQLLHFI